MVEDLMSWGPRNIIDDVPIEDTRLLPTEATAVSNAPNTSEGRLAEIPPLPEHPTETRPRHTRTATRFFIL